MSVRKDEVNLFACFVFLTPRKILAWACQKFLHPAKNPHRILRIESRKSEVNSTKEKRSLTWTSSSQAFPAANKKKEEQKKKSRVGKKKKRGENQWQQLTFKVPSLFLSLSSAESISIEPESCDGLRKPNWSTLPRTSSSAAPPCCKRNRKQEQEQQQL